MIVVVVHYKLVVVLSPREDVTPVGKIVGDHRESIPTMENSVNIMLVYRYILLVL